MSMAGSIVGARPSRQAGSGWRAGVQSPQPAPVSSLLIDAPVRSGQAIVHPDGDVTIVGSVSSGAEIIAAGSIHVYGTLRGKFGWCLRQPTGENLLPPAGR